MSDHDPAAAAPPRTAPAATAAPDAAARARGRLWRRIWEYVRTIGLAILLALFIRQFLVQAFRIPTGSMERTLLVGDFLFVNKFVYGARTPDRIRLFGHDLVDGLPVLKLPAFGQPRQGDIIVFEYPRDRDLDYIKRCVAVAGDVVEMRGGILYVNDEIYESNFGERDGDHSCVPDPLRADGCPPPRAYHDPERIGKGSRFNQDFPAHVVPPGHIFMMGDNRYNSLDSRFWGDLDLELVKGKAMFIYFSWDQERHLPRLGRIGDIIR
jgi:signal peptidase I